MRFKLLSATVGVWFCVIGSAVANDVVAAAITVPALAVADFAGQPASADARYAAHWVVTNADNQGRPFAIVDKKNARLFIFGQEGRLMAATPVLLGMGVGDVSVAGIALRDPSGLKPAERITPAGRFVSEPGHNLHGEDIVWVDYDAKVAIHRLRPDASHQRRANSLASRATTDKRMSLGCVVVPVSFYENVVRPVFGKRYGVIYVLPENRPVESMFEALAG